MKVDMDLQVGSLDPWCGQWAAEVRSQGHRLEIIEVHAWGQHQGAELCCLWCAARSPYSSQSVQATRQSGSCDPCW